jgi:ornithine lipid ester-linked acyl 2-hydroxylase
MRSTALWYNYWMPDYSEMDFPFAEDHELPWKNELEEKFVLIKLEVSRLLNDHSSSMKPYFIGDMHGGKDQWKTLTIKTWGIENKSIVKNHPELMQVFERIPGLLSLAVSRLAPESSIAPHAGDTNAIFRCHMGITVPGVLPDCGIRVSDRQMSWKEGKVLGFCDAFDHEVWNTTENERVILIFDVLRPEFLNQKSRICRNVRAFMLLQVLTGRFSILRRRSKRCHKAIHLFLQFLLFILYPYQKRKGLILKN